MGPREELLMATDVKIPADILEAAGLTEADCLIELAVHLYAERRVTIGQALRLSRLSRPDFEKELARRDISLYSVEDLENDVAALKELGRM
jgi:predicted HTH domain antitoxin